METPRAWKEISTQSTDAYNGRIAINAKDTLDFSYGFGPSHLSYGVLMRAYWDDLDIPAMKYPVRIDGCVAYTQAPQQITNWMARIYIDTVFYTGRAVMRFDFYGRGLSPVQERQFYTAARTIKFENKVNR